jgi:hypothetical protein
VTINIKQAAAQFHRFDVLWTPTVLFLDSGGVERSRLEGYVRRNEFAAQLDLALGRIAFMHKNWVEAENRYNQVVREYADTVSAAEAVYWAGVSHYKKTNDHTVLGRVGQELAEKYPDSIWAQKASVWAPPQPQAKTA